MLSLIILIQHSDNTTKWQHDLTDWHCTSLALGFEVIQVVAVDLDQPNTDNSDIRYRIMSQDPELPSRSMFVINANTGAIRVNAPGLDREVCLIKTDFSFTSSC